MGQMHLRHVQVIEVTSDGSKLGELRISRGTIDWVPKNHAYATSSLTWEQFDVLMRNPAE